jgi:hypothetical protein
MPISVYRLGELPIQSCGQSLSAPRGKAGVSLNARTELRAKRQHSARKAIYRNQPVKNHDSNDVEGTKIHNLAVCEGESRSSCDRLHVGRSPRTAPD